MSNDEMFATSGSAANSSTLNPGGTLNDLMAPTASSLAAITLRGPGGPEGVVDSWPRTTVANSASTNAIKAVCIARDITGISHVTSRPERMRPQRRRDAEEDAEKRKGQGVVSELPGVVRTVENPCHALMENELVTRRRWLDRDRFLDLVALVNFIPGPNSTELAIHLGLLRAGFRGLLVAGQYHRDRRVQQRHRRGGGDGPGGEMNGLCGTLSIRSPPRHGGEKARMEDGG